MNETHDMIKGDGFDGFRSLPPTRKRFVLSVASGADPVEAIERISPHLTKGSRQSTATRYMQEPRIISALSDIQRLKNSNIDISYNKQVERFFSLIGLIHQQPVIGPKHLELIFKIYQELNRMAGHMKNDDGAQVNFSPVQIIIEKPIEIEHSRVIELSENNETSIINYNDNPAIDIIPPTQDDDNTTSQEGTIQA